MAGTIGVLVSWISAGAFVFGMKWLVETLQYLSAAAIFGVVATLIALARLYRMWNVGGPATPVRDILDSVLGTGFVCAFIFAAYRSYVDFDIDQSKTIFQLEMTAAGFFMAYVFGPLFFSRLFGK